MPTTSTPNQIAKPNQNTPGLYEARLDAAMSAGNTSVAVAWALAEILEKPVTEFGPIAKYIDPDALDDIVRKNGSRWLAHNVNVQFRVDDLAIEVGSDGHMYVLDLNVMNPPA